MNARNFWIKSLVVFVMAGLLLSACAPASPNTAPIRPPAGTGSAGNAGDNPSYPVSKPDGGSDPQPIEIPVEQAAMKELGKQLGIPVDQVKIIKVEDVQWPDACLGFPKAGEACAEMIVEGYRVTLQINGTTYEVHTDKTGAQIRTGQSSPQSGQGQQPTSRPGDQANLPEAVRTARQVLAQQLQAAPDEINVDRFEHVEWPNACLGVQTPGRMCAQAVTPGYKIIFSLAGKQFEYHTDEAGGAVIQAIAPLPQTNEKVIAWESTENNACRRVEIGVEMVAFGPCGGRLPEKAISPARQAELRQLLGTYESFSGATRAGTISLNGSGTKQATVSEQRSVAEWAKLVGQETEAGRASAGEGAALSWHQVGGIAGFCDDLVIYTTGWAAPSSCKGNNPKVMNSFRLTAAQLDDLYGWIDRYQRFEFEQKDPAGVSDAMAVTLTFEGQGAQAAPIDVQREIATFAGIVFTQTPR